MRIRHTEMPVVVVDVTSEYPTCAALLGIWQLLTAADVLVEMEPREVEVADLRVVVHVLFGIVRVDDLQGAVVARGVRIRDRCAAVEEPDLSLRSR